MSWAIDAEWESLTGGSVEESACFAALGVQVNDRWLTEGHDYLANRLRRKPYLSAYHLAEWLAWNWWRLRWEPRSRKAADWEQSHRMSSIGGGYIWPNITIFSDGERTALIANPTEERGVTPYRYIANMAEVIPAGQYEAGVDDFLNRVLERLDGQSVASTNLHAVIGSLNEERRTRDLAVHRKLEALLGVDPDEGDPGLLRNLAVEAARVGLDAIEEIAASKGASGTTITVEDLRDVASTRGAAIDIRSAVRLSRRYGVHASEQVAAWQVGASAAQALREQERLGVEPISDQRLAELAGASQTILSRHADRDFDIAFTLEDDAGQGRVVLRSRRSEGRRFELARLIGDRLLTPAVDKLHPATGASTYRQKMQRAFAAEFLGPFEAIDGLLMGDYSNDNLRDVAEKYKVSELMVRTQLVNHRRIRRDEALDDFDIGAGVV